MPIDASIEKDRPGKVFVGGLATEITEEDLEKKFSVYGRLTEGTIYTYNLTRSIIDATLDFFADHSICQKKISATSPDLHFQLFLIFVCINVIARI